MAAIPALRVVTSCANLSEFVRVFRARAGTDTLEVPGVAAPPPLDTVGRLVVTLANRVTILDGDAAVVAAPGGGLTIRFTRLDVRSRGLLLHLLEVRDAATLGPVPRHLVPLGAPVGDPAAAREGAELSACAIEPLSARPADPAKRAMPVLPTLRGRPSTSPPPTGMPAVTGAAPVITGATPAAGTSPVATGASPITPPVTVPGLPRVGPPVEAAPSPAKLAAAAYTPRPTVATRLPPPPTIPTVRTPALPRPGAMAIVETIPPPLGEVTAPSAAVAEAAPPSPIVEPARLPGPPIAAPPPRVTATITVPAAPMAPAAPTIPEGATARPSEKARRRREEQSTLIGVRMPRVDADTDPQRPAAPAPPPPRAVEPDTDPQRAAAPPRLPIIEHEYTLHGPAPVRTTGPGLGDFTSPDLARAIPDDGLSGGVTLRGIAVPAELDTGETEANHGHDDLATDVAFALPDDPGDDLDPLVDPPAPMHLPPRGVALAVSKASATPRPVARHDSGPTPGADVAVTAPMAAPPHHDPFDDRPAVASAPPPAVLPSGTAPAPIPLPGAWATPSWSPVPGASPSSVQPPPQPIAPPPQPIAPPPQPIAQQPIVAPVIAPSPSEPIPSLHITPPPVDAPVPLARHGTTPLPMMAPVVFAPPPPAPVYTPPPPAPVYAPPPPVYQPPPAPPIYPTAQLRALDYSPPPASASQNWRRRVEVSEEGTDMTEIISVPRLPRRRRWPVIVITTAVIVVLAIVGIIVASSSGDDGDAPTPAPAPAPAPGSSAAPEVPAAPRADTTEAPAAPAPPAAPAQPAAAPAPPAVADGTTCRATFTSVPPGATVVVAGAPLGTTPLTVDVPCDAAAVAFKRDRYQTRTLALTLAPSAAPTEVHTRLDRPSWTVTLTSRPAGAKITVAGRAAGTTPAKIQVPAYDGALVELALPGYRPERQRVAPTRNNQKIELRLRRK